MALSNVATIETAITNIFGALKQGAARRSKGRAGQEALSQVQNALRDAYNPDAKVTITNGAETIATSFSAAGEVGLALGRAAAAGDVFEVQGTGDFLTVTDLTTAKGSAPAAGDRFEVLSASTVAYLGAAFDFSAEQSEDFISIGA